MRDGIGNVRRRDRYEHRGCRSRRSALFSLLPTCSRVGCYGLRSPLAGDRLAAPQEVLFPVHRCDAIRDSLAVGALIFGGVLERVPDLKVVFAHGGGSVPYILPRMERGWNVWAPARENILRPPSEYLARCYFDSITWDDVSLGFLVGRVGAERVLLGSDYPFIMGEERPGTIVGQTGLSEEDKNLILGGNCRRLLGLDHTGAAQSAVTGG